MGQKVKLLSRVWLFAIPWTIACQVPPSMGLSRQEYWNGLPFNIELKFYMCVLSCLSRVQLFETPWTVIHQAPLSMGFSRQEYWSGLPCPPPGDLPNPGIKSVSPLSPALAGRFFTTRATWEAQHSIYVDSISSHNNPWIRYNYYSHFSVQENEEKIF